MSAATERRERAAYATLDWLGAYEGSYGTLHTARAANPVSPADELAELTDIPRDIIDAFDIASEAVRAIIAEHQADDYLTRHPSHAAHRRLIVTMFANAAILPTNRNEV